MIAIFIKLEIRTSQGERGGNRDIPCKRNVFDENDRYGGTNSKSDGCRLGTLGEIFLLTVLDRPLLLYGGPMRHHTTNSYSVKVDFADKL